MKPSKRMARWVKPARIVGGLVAMGAGLWLAAVWMIVPATRLSKADCGLMAQALKDYSPEGVRAGLVLEADPSCDWRGLGIAPPPPRQAPSTEAWDFKPWISVSPPRYSLLRTRASLEVGGEWIALGGGGEHCIYQRSLRGWRQLKCETAWIS